VQNIVPNADFGIQLLNYDVFAVTSNIAQVKDTIPNLFLWEESLHNDWKNLWSL